MLAIGRGSGFGPHPGSVVHEVGCVFIRGGIQTGSSVELRGYTNTAVSIGPLI